jgi:3-methylcrotonyl-CoA carboxylase beta subunit
LFKLETNLDLNKTVFKNNYSEFKSLLYEYKAILNKTTNGGSEKAKDIHIKRGKLLARERIDLLLDPNTPFLEFSPLAAYNQYDNNFPSAGIVTGLGVVHGKEVIVIANDATVKGGTYIQHVLTVLC